VGGRQSMLVRQVAALIVLCLLIGGLSAPDFSQTSGPKGSPGVSNSDNPPDTGRDFDDKTPELAALEAKVRRLEARAPRGPD